MPAKVQTGISLSSRITAKLQKLPSLPGDARERSTVGELWEGLARSPGMYVSVETGAGRILKASGTWSLLLRPKIGQRMVSQRIILNVGRPLGHLMREVAALVDSWA